MTALQAIITAILQGVTELFPVSSLGHAVVLPRLLGWHIDQDAPDYLPFLVVLHLGTAAALLVYFWRDWSGIARRFVGRGRAATSGAPTGASSSSSCVATIPAVILGFALEKSFRALFGAPAVAAAFLIVNGFVLFVGERLRRRAGERTLDRDALGRGARHRAVAKHGAHSRHLALGRDHGGRAAAWASTTARRRISRS